MYNQCINNVLIMYFIGKDVTLEIFAEELSDLWKDGIQVGDIKYRIGLVNGVWDGKGFEQVTKTQGACSVKGCNACDFPGLTFARTVCYPFYARYLPADDPRRLKSSANQC